jgi:hypothetical protein
VAAHVDAAEHGYVRVHSVSLRCCRPIVRWWAMHRFYHIALRAASLALFGHRCGSSTADIV